MNGTVHMKRVFPCCTYQSSKNWFALKILKKMTAVQPEDDLKEREPRQIGGEFYII